MTRSGIGRTRELVDTVRWTLLNPAAVFRGVRDLDRELDEDDWLCYAARPPRAYDYRTGQSRAAWPGQVVMVLVTDERVVYSWMWVERDPRSPNLPVGYETRFRERLL